MTIKKSSLFGLLALLFWSPVPLLYLRRLNFLAGHPLAIYAFILITSGLSFAALSLFYLVKRRMSLSAARLYAVLFILAGVSIYQFSGLAPNWNCFGKQIYVATANAAGQNCTTTCTNNDKKPCSGWSSCWDKFVSCNSAGRDQDGRGCGGCCFSCKVVCEPEEDPDPDNPPTITASVSCSQSGKNGWCIGDSSLNLTASDPQGYAVTISGDIAGQPFTCAAGATSCSKNLPDGNGTINYKVTASTSGKTKTGSTTWKKDIQSPEAAILIPAPTGSNGWFKTLPVNVSISGTDSLSGIAIARVSPDGAVNWQANGLVLSADGQYLVYYGAEDVAGNSVDYLPAIINIDTSPPSFAYSSVGTNGSGGWYISDVTTNITTSDSLSGVDWVEYDQNGSGWQTGSTIVSSDGDNSISIRVYDKAGNVSTSSLSIRVDTTAPVITPSISGNDGSNGWFISPVDVSAVLDDPTSGIVGNVEASLDDGSSWQGLPLSLDDGVYEITIHAFDEAGNEGLIKIDASIDTLAPTLDFVFHGTIGENGWYVSNVDASVHASDATSGVNEAVIRADGGDWLPQLTLTDGVYKLDGLATDNAGNSNSISSELRIDNTPPVSKFLNHSNNDVVSGIVNIRGLSLDSGSGIASTEISVDGGKTWNEIPHSKDQWSFDWDSSLLQNGTYIIQMRATDQAGNIESPISLHLIAANYPPFVKITDSWWIWESGAFKVSTNAFPIAEIKVTISDPQNRWKPIVLEYNPTVTSSTVTWDRRFGAVIAPSGNYHATVLACDIYGNCASDRGVIHIPIIAPVPPSATPSPIPTSMPTESALPTVTKTLVPRSQPTQLPQIIVTPQIGPVAPQRMGFANQPSWVVAFITLLVLLFGTTSLLDPRPKALHALAKTIDQFNTLKSIYDKE